ncbi:MAG: right-handed parallel beta-helix repeat-containing protein [bacterium]|nr:right-handed parallel beta-helix repeat-containing protein [bacterium]
MKLLRGLVFVLLVVISTGRADTTWVASGNVSGVWNASGSPYMIHSGDITVATGQTLLINPGVKVYFAGQFKLIVNGLLQAIGSQSDSIWFTGSSADFPFDSPTRWRGLRFVDAHEDCQLSYCSISYSGATGAGALSYGGGLYCLNTDLRMEYCWIHHCHAGSGASHGSGCGAYFDQSDVLLEYTDITNNSGTIFEEGYAYSTPGGGFATSNTTIHLRHCKVQRNRPGINVGGIRFGGGTIATLDTCLIDDNWTPDGGWQGIVADTTAVLTMTGTTISNHNFPAAGFTNGLRAIGATLTMEACTLRNNSAGWINPDPTCLTAERRC